MNPTIKRQIRNFMIEMVIYGGLVLVYFLVILRFLGDWLFDLFNNNLLVYAVTGLILILAQSVILDWLTTFIVRLFGLERLE
jgi:hypothetical protein